MTREVFSRPTGSTRGSAPRLENDLLNIFSYPAVMYGLSLMGMEGCRHQCVPLAGF